MLYNGLRIDVLKYNACLICTADEKGSAEENVYFKKEDESLLKNLLSNHPEFNPKYSTALLEEEVGTLARDLRLGGIPMCYTIVRNQ